MSPTGDPRSSHLESEAGLCVNLVPGGGGGRRFLERLAEATVGSVFSHGIWEQEDKTAPTQRLGREKSLPRSRRWVAAESTPVISQGGRQVIGLAEPPPCTARCPCLTEPGCRWQAWDLREGNQLKRSGEEQKRQTDAPAPRCTHFTWMRRVCWAGRLVS